MANLCEFSMKVVGENKENIETFFHMLTQKGTTYMGRGAEAYLDGYNEENGKHSAEIYGDCKWSIKASLILDAISMRTNPEMWTFGKTNWKDILQFVTLYEASEQLNLDVEVYSSEPGCEFQEHYLCRHGEVDIDEWVHYTEEYDEESDEYVKTGGYEDWSFSIQLKRSRLTARGTASREDIYMKAIIIYKEELNSYLQANKYPYLLEETTDGKLVCEIHWGDWKHEHLRLDWLVKEFFDEKDLTVAKEAFTTEEDGSDCYSADRYYWLVNIE